MKFTVAILALAGTLVYGAMSAGTVAAQGKSQWDGVYTEAQAKRGEGLYAQYCASCHGPDLAGWSAAETELVVRGAAQVVAGLSELRSESADEPVPPPMLN